MDPLGQFRFVIIVALLSTASPATPLEDITRRAIGDRCVGTLGTGDCRATAACKGISYLEPFCLNDPYDIQCCVEIPCQFNGGSGFCRSISNNGCPGGSFHKGNPPNWPCPGSQDIQCCISHGSSLTPGGSGQTPGRVCDLECQKAETDRLLFQVSLDEFLAARDARNPPYLNWESNRCGPAGLGLLVPDSPLGFDFTEACYRHDFGYNNYREQGRLTEDNRGRIDLSFHSALKAACREEFPPNKIVFGVRVPNPQFVACNALADLYYHAVRHFGDE